MRNLEAVHHREGKLWHACFLLHEGHRLTQTQLVCWACAVSVTALPANKERRVGRASSSAPRGDSRTLRSSKAHYPEGICMCHARSIACMGRC